MMDSGSAFLSAFELSRMLVPRPDPNVLLLYVYAPRRASPPLLIARTDTNEQIVHEMLELMRDSPLALLRTTVVLYARDSGDAVMLMRQAATLRRRVQCPTLAVRLFVGGLAEWLALRAVFHPSQFPCQPWGDGDGNGEAIDSTPEGALRALRLLFREPEPEAKTETTPQPPTA